jgi:hypothetical protein
MKNIMIRFIIVSLLATFVSVTAVQAQPEKKDEAKRTAIDGTPFRGRLTAVDAKANTITVAGKESGTFEVTPQTKIMKDGKSVTLADAKVGDEVGGFAQKKGDKYELRSLRLGQKSGSGQRLEKIEKKKNE